MATNKADIRIIEGRDKIAKEALDIPKKANTLRRKIHQVAVSCVVHAQQNSNDFSLLTLMHHALGQSKDTKRYQNKLKSWFGKVAPVEFDVEKSIELPKGEQSEGVFKTSDKRKADKERDKGYALDYAKENNPMDEGRANDGGEPEFDPYQKLNQVLKRMTRLQAQLADNGCFVEAAAIARCIADLDPITDDDGKIKEVNPQVLQSHYKGDAGKLEEQWKARQNAPTSEARQ